MHEFWKKNSIYIGTPKCSCKKCLHSDPEKKNHAMQLLTNGTTHTCNWGVGGKRSGFASFKFSISPVLWARSCLLCTGLDNVESAPRVPPPPQRELEEALCFRDTLWNTCPQQQALSPSSPLIFASFTGECNKGSSSHSPLLCTGSNTSWPLDSLGSHIH